MARWNCTTRQSQLDELSVCFSLLESFDSKMRLKMLRVNALLVTSAILAGVIVGIGVCCQRYRHRPFTRFIYLTATTLFLPIISSVFSLSAEPSDYIMPLSKGSFLIVKCYPSGHGIQVVIWSFLVHIIIINTSVVVAMDDREGQNIGPPFELLVQGAWSMYIGIVYMKSILVTASILFTIVSILFFAMVPFALICAKIMLKYYAFQNARRSFELGRNPLLIVGYMQQLQQEETNKHGDLQVDEDAPPQLLVTGEGRGHMEMKPCGYIFKDGSGAASAINNTSLVTIDSVWTCRNSLLPMSRPQLKDLCLSFALFKLLRCRFARYKLANAGSTRTLDFFWSLLLKGGEHTRVFGVIADELSFVNDYYYSSLPISYSKCCLPIWSTIISLLIIGYFILFMVAIIINIRKGKTIPQLACTITCMQGSKVCELMSPRGFGNLKYFDMVPILLLIVLVIITEGRDMASYICSNWTKVSLICRTVNSTSSRNFLHMPKWVDLLLNCRCKPMNHWDGKMGQCSVLVTGPVPSSLMAVLSRHLLRIPDRKRKIKVPEAVKACIIDTLRSSNRGRQLRNGKSSLRRIEGGESFVWACKGKGTCDTILTWHIATCIFEAHDRPHRRGHQEQGSPPPVSYSHHNKVAATHLSRYCVYLVTWYPELLPDDNDAWIKSLYKDVKKDAERALAGHASAIRSSTPEEYQKLLVELLSQNSEHEVLKNGVKLGKQLVETINNEETAWKFLADFWSEMILYVAPSDNLKGHSEAIASGGELITLLWALLFHAGIVSRPGEEEDGVAAATSSAGAV